MTSDVIRFIHNDKIIEIKDSDPNETVLNYVREKYKKTGTKEGCAEGGCGACTIVVGTLNKNNIDYEAINSCIAFLPMINGKQLILVEDLAKDSKSLHPVQEAMYNFHGSQCGFCTPGFVMSLFAMFKNNYIYDDETIKDSISGNLCRCTGYNPIIKAAKSLNGKNKIDKFFKNKNLTINLL
ncbi:MAG: Caffeine dehydrogenase subunit gamma, partial [Alphaproteobacteria bacterium MarineAlpha5_Bin11]